MCLMMRDMLVLVALALVKLWTAKYSTSCVMSYGQTVTCSISTHRWNLRQRRTLPSRVRAQKDFSEIQDCKKCGDKELFQPSPPLLPSTPPPPPTGGAVSRSRRLHLYKLAVRKPQYTTCSPCNQRRAFSPPPLRGGKVTIYFRAYCMNTFFFFSKMRN